MQSLSSFLAFSMLEDKLGQGLLQVVIRSHVLFHNLLRSRPVPLHDLVPQCNAPRDAHGAQLRMLTESSPIEIRFAKIPT